MTDVRQLSDEELLKAIQAKRGATSAQSLSDEELLEALRSHGVESQQVSPYETEAQTEADRIEKFEAGKYGGGRGVASRFSDAFSLGLEDKVAGLVGGVGSFVQGKGFGPGYGVAQRSQEIIEERARERSGGLGTAAEIGGTLASGAFAKAPAAASWVGRGWQALKEGAILGAGQGLGQAGGSPSEMVSGTAGGAALGAGTGLGLSTGISALAGAGRGFKRAGRSVRRMLDDPQERGVRLINEALQSDATTPGQVAARMSRSQADTNAPNLTLMDTADENTLGLAAAASARPGPGRRILNSYLESRARGARGSAMGAASDALGDPNSFRRDKQMLEFIRAQKGDRMYGAAWQSAGSVNGVNDIVMQLDNRIPSAKGGIKSTLERIRSLLVRKGSMGEMIERDLKSLHEAKLELDNMLSSRGDDSVGRVSRGEIAKVRRHLLKVMDDASPEYRAARNEYADQSALMNAMEMGREFLKGDVDELADTMATMGRAERQMFMQGAVREIRHLVESAPDGADVVKRVFGSEAKRAALRAVFPNAKQYREFQATMLRLASARHTRDVAGVRRGSRTAVLQAEQDAASGTNEVINAGIDLATTGGVGTVANRTLTALSKMFQARSRVSPDVAEAMARIMIEEDPNTVMRLLSQGPSAVPLPTPSPVGAALRRAVPASASTYAAGIGSR